MLGIDVNEAQNGDFMAALSLAESVGMEVASLTVYWDELETAPGVYNPVPNWLEIANIFYPLQQMKLQLNVVPLDTIQNRMPADLRGRSWDDPLVISRFQDVLTYVFAQIPAVQLVSVSIGNEVDVAIAGNTSVWEQYQRFFSATAAYARLLRPGVQIGVKTTYDGAMVKAPAPINRLNQSSDVILITYYPLWSNYTVKHPSVVLPDWQALLKAFPSKPIIFAEIGYPSSSTSQSSQAKQKAFVDRVFEAWDIYQDRIPLLMFVRLHDISDAEAAGLAADYGLSSARSVAFLKTLGLRLYTGTDKLAFATLKQHTYIRGW